MQGRAQPEKLTSLRRNAEIVLEAIGMTGTAENETRARANRELVDVLRRSKLFRDYERVFAQAIGVAARLARPTTNVQRSGRGTHQLQPRRPAAVRCIALLVIQ